MTRIGGATAEFSREGGLLAASFSLVCETGLGERVLFDANGLVLKDCDDKILITNQ